MTSTHTTVKGVGFNAAMNFAEETLGEGAVRAALQPLEAEHGSWELHRLPSAQVPISAAEAAWHAVAELRGGTFDDKRRFFQQMGVHIASSNLSGIYKRLLALIASPSRLAKRIPSLWTTYFGGVSVDLDTAQLAGGEVSCAIHGFEGVQYINAVGIGWLEYALELVGGENVFVMESNVLRGEFVAHGPLQYVHRWAV